MGGRQSISSIIFRVTRTFGRLRLTQVQVESIGSVWPAEDASLELRHVLPGAWR